MTRTVLRFPGGRLFLKFAGVSLLTMAAIGVGTTSLLLISQKQVYEEEMRSRWMEIARISGHSLENALLADDPALLHGIADGLAREEDISRCRVFNRRGMVLSAVGFAESERDPLVARCLVDRKPVFAEPSAARGSGEKVEIAQPIVVEGELWGVVRITFSLDRLDRMTRGLYGRLGILALVGGAVALLGSLLLAMHVSGPVVRLARLAQDVAGGDLDVTCALRRHDELGDLAESFDGMVSKLRASRTDLEGARRYVESILESMVDSVIVIDHPPTDPDSGPKIKTVNRATLSLLGYGEEDLVGQSVDAVLGSRSERESVISRILGSGTVRNLQVGYSTATGETRRMLLSASAMGGSGRSPEGEPEEITAFVLVASDITELKRAEGARMATHMVSDSVNRAESLPDVYRSVHEILVALMPAEVLQIALAPAGRSELEPEYDSRGEGDWSLPRHIALVGKPLHLTEATIRDLADQDVISNEGDMPTECIGVPLRLGDRSIGVMAVQSHSGGQLFSASDLDLLNLITDRIAMAIERKQAESERLRLSLAVEQAADGIIITDTRGVIRYVNPAFTRICGFTGEDAVGNFTFFLWSGAHDRRAFARLWRGVAQGEEWSGRMSNRHKDGSPYQVDVSVSRVLSPSGEVGSYVAVCHDVTNEVALESQLRQAQKMEAVGELAGGIAHDFNNLLSVITGYSSLYLEEHGGDRPGIEMINEVNRAGIRAASLTRQLLAFSRRQVLKPQIVNLNRVIADIETLLRRLIGEDVELATSLDPLLGSVEVDPGQVEQVVMNLAVNARDAMPEGGRLTIETGNVVLGAGSFPDSAEVRPGAYARLVVTDTGEGMDDETLSRIFEPFFTTKEVGKGTGLGLSTVYGIVKQSEGHIAAFSEAGRGASFHVCFPRIGADSKPAEAPEEADAEALRGDETILLVEDEPGVRNMSRDLLTRKGYRVLTAENGREALEISQSFAERIDLLLTDVIMPEMSGQDLVQKLLEARPETKVMYMSGYTDAAIVRHGVLDPGTEFIEKPFQLQDLLRRTREILN